MASASFSVTVVAPRSAIEAHGRGHSISAWPRTQRSTSAARQPAVPARPAACRAAAGRTRRARALSTRCPTASTSAAPGACGPRGCVISSSPAASRRTLRGRGAAVVELDALAQLRSAGSRTGALRTTARGRSCGTSKDGCVSRWASSPSSVSRISPVVSASRRPTGYSRAVGLRRGRRRSRRPCGVAGGRDDARGLVERVDRALVLGGADRPAVDRDRVAAVDVARRVAHDLAADGHAPVEDELLGGAPRGDAGVGEVLGEAHGAATIGAADGPRAPRRDARRRRRARLPRPPGVALDRERRGRLRRDDRPAGRAARRGSRPRSRSPR